MIQRRAPTAQELDAACGLPLLEPLEPERLAAIVGASGLMHYTASTPLFSAGDPADRFFAVLSGAVRLHANTPDGRETTIAMVESLATFAEAAMLAFGRFPVNATALAGATLLHIPARGFLAELRSEPGLGLRMLRSLRNWELYLLRELNEAKLLPPVRRLAGFVLSLCDDHSGPTSVRLPFRKTLLASKLGIQPETLSRNLQRLASIGVTSSGDTVTIDDPATLLQVFRGEVTEY